MSRHGLRRLTLAMLMSCPASAALRGQESVTAGAAARALETCARLAEADPPPAGPALGAARAAADTAESLHRAWVEARPGDVEALVGLGQVLSRCQTPFAGITRVVAILDQSNEALQRALRLDPTHWLARYVLAMNHFRPPEFMGRTDDAVREFETLLLQQGSRTDLPLMATPFLYLGDLYVRKGRRSDARAVWERGAALFPGNGELRERLAGGSGADPDTGPPGTGQAGIAGPGTRQPGGTSDSQDGLPRLIALDPLVVEARDHQLEGASSGTALKRLDVLTTPGGAADIMHSLQTLPGVTRAAEGADLYVRGGEPGETAIFLDGGRVLSPGRWETVNGSVMGVLDANVLRSAYFSAGGFSARYGNALSGVVDAASEDLPVRSSARAGLSLVQAAATARAAVSPGFGMWASAALTDVGLASRMSGQDDFIASPRSTQGAVALIFQPVQALRVKATALAATDRATREVEVGGFRGPFASTGGTAHVTVSARLMSADGRRGLTVGASNSASTSETRYGVLDQSRTDEAFSVRGDGDLVVQRASRIRGGVEATAFGSEYSGRVPATDRLAPGAPTTAVAAEREDRRHLAAYVEVESEPVAGATLVAGIRADRLPGERGVTVDPRLAVAYRRADWAFRIGAGTFQQGRWRPRYQLPDGGRPSGVARTARHFVLSAERDGEPSVRIEAYAKRYGRFVPRGEGPLAESGDARGVDAVVRWSRQDRLNGWLSYSFLDAETRLLGGSVVPSNVDVTHSITGVGRLALNERWELGTTVRLATGRPITAILGAAGPGDPIPGPRYGPTNGSRLPAYARTDARVTRYSELRAGLLVAYLEVLNLLDRPNIMGYSYGEGYEVRTALRSYFAERTAILGFEFQIR